MVEKKNRVYSRQKGPNDSIAKRTAYKNRGSSQLSLSNLKFVVDENSVTLADSLSSFTDIEDGRDVESRNENDGNSGNMQYSQYSTNPRKHAIQKVEEDVQSFHSNVRSLEPDPNYDIIGDIMESPINSEFNEVRTPRMSNNSNRDARVSQNDTYQRKVDIAPKNSSIDTDNRENDLSQGEILTLETMRKARKEYFDRRARQRGRRNIESRSISSEPIKRGLKLFSLDGDDKTNKSSLSAPDVMMPNKVISSIGNSSLSITSKDVNISPSSATWNPSPTKIIHTEKIIEKLQRLSLECDSNGIEKKQLQVLVLTYDPQKDIVEEIRSFMTSVQADIQLQALEDIKDKKKRKRVILYCDSSGSLHNVVLRRKVISGITETWERSFFKLDGLEAIITLVLLLRVFGCQQGDTVQASFLTLYLGIIFPEIISHSFLNNSIYVRGIPSIASLMIETQSKSDYFRLSCMLLLVLAIGANPGSETQKNFVVLGSSLAFFIILVNIGSRAWHVVGLQSITVCSRNTILNSICSLLAASFCGILLPYLSLMPTDTGGELGLWKILLSSLVVAFVFIISDLDEVQNLIAMGSSECEQGILNLLFGFWYPISLLASISFAKNELIRLQSESKEESGFVSELDTMVVEDHSSPVGWVVADLPNLSFSLSDFSKKSSSCCSDIDVVQSVAIATSVVAGVAVIGLASYQVQSDGKDLWSPLIHLYGSMSSNVTAV